MDSSLMPERVERCGLAKFSGWMLFCIALCAWGLVSAFLCLWLGLNQTGMNDYFPFGLWIVFDLAVIALGAGAFFTGFLTYILRKHELKAIISCAVIVGFICYSGAILMLGVDIGQPIRGWFGFWHANVHSMLTEVMFCITTYLIVLTIEYVPLIFENRKLDRIPELHLFGHNLHSIMIVFAGVGTFLSFFHQGSLGGMYGVLYARPFAYRTGFMIWPWTFFLFTWSAAAFGPCFTLMVTKITEIITGKKLVGDKTVNLLAKISGWMITTYIIAKIIDTVYWAFVTVPSMGFELGHFYSNNAFYGYWILITEVILCGVVPGLLLINKSTRENPTTRTIAIILGVIGVCLNRWVMVLQIMAVPVMSFDSWALYIPSWQEVATTILPVAYGIILIAVAYRYLPVFPQELELNEPADAAAQN
ncbi:MAG TPA: molybdopterin oxidoreductase [Desulfobacter sp.]|nr:molybdopterin oxidoreductase [Desulfobacter sp.]